MNKGIIMEIKKDYAIAMNDNGIMEKIQSKDGMKVGQKIFYFEDDIIKITAKPHRYNNFIKSFGSIAALFLIVFTFFQTFSGNKAYAVVSLDINPSIQIEADNKQKIIKVEGVNADGKNMSFDDVIGESLDDGIQKIKDKLIEANYLDKNKEVLVAFAFVQNSGNSNYEEDVKDVIQSTFNTEKVTYVKAEKNDVEEAKTQGISLGRYEVAINADPETKNKIDKAPVKDITSIIKDNQNVIQWNAQDEEAKMDNTQATSTNAQTTDNKPSSTQSTDSKTTTDKTSDTTKASDKTTESKSTNDKTTESKSTSDKDKTTTDKSTQEKTKNSTATDKTDDGTASQQTEKNTNASNADNGTLEVKPEVPSQQGEKSNTNTNSDNNITIGNNNGVMQNNTTSSKVEDQDKNESTQELPKDNNKQENKVSE